MLRHSIISTNKNTRINYTSFYIWILLFAFCIPDTADAWWNGDWQYRKAININLNPNFKDAAKLQAIPLRLHTANFPYFYSLAEGGADIRIISEDDQTPLAFHIESLDIITGLGLIWVQLPENLGNSESYKLWLYYGNPDAVSNADSTASFDPDTTVVYHFAEKMGMPRDSSAFGHHAISNSATSGTQGYHNNGVSLLPSSSIKLPDSPALIIDDKQGLSFETWIKYKESGAIINYESDELSWSLQVENKTPVINLVSAEFNTRLAANKNLITDNWHHIALSWDKELLMLIDGNVVLNEPISIESAQGSYTVGYINDETPSFTGSLDELRIYSKARPDNYFNFTQSIQNSNSTLVNYLADEENDTSAASKILASLWPLLNNIGLAGWLVIGVLTILGLIAADVIITKLYYLSRIHHADKNFAHDCKENYKGNYLSAISSEHFIHRNSPHWRILHSAKHAIQHLPHVNHKIPGLHAESIRASLDETLMKETNRINSHMVWINIAVSGGPFLGLLGTVIGVMITFATIAQSGDVNVNTIAPGVAAALTTTVLGLIVAIPALFGFNFLANKLGNTISELESYTDKLAVLIAIHLENKAHEVKHAQA